MFIDTQQRDNINKPIFHRLHIEIASHVLAILFLFVL